MEQFGRSDQECPDSLSLDCSAGRSSRCRMSTSITVSTPKTLLWQFEQPEEWPGTAPAGKDQQKHTISPFWCSLSLVWIGLKGGWGCWADVPFRTGPPPGAPQVHSRAEPNGLSDCGHDASGKYTCAPEWEYKTVP